MNEIKEIIYNKFGKDCGNILLNYKKDLDNYELCTEITNDLYNKIINWDAEMMVIGLSERIFRLYDKITISEFIYFLKYYINNEKKKMFKSFTFKVNIRDNYNNFNEDYWLTNTIYEFNRFLNILEHYNYLEIRSFKKRGTELTFNLFDNYIKKPKLYEKIYQKIYEKIKKLINRYN